MTKPMGSISIFFEVDNGITLRRHERLNAYRPKPFEARDIVDETCTYIASQGVSIDSDTREAFREILVSKLASGEIASGADTDTCDEEDRASRSRGELKKFENKFGFSKTIYMK